MLFPSCPKPLFQSEAECKAIALEFFFFYTHANKTHFHKKGFALSPVLKVRVLEVRKQPRSQVRSRGPWERGCFAEWSIKFNVRNVFSFVVFRTRTAAKVMSIER